MSAFIAMLIVNTKALAYTTCSATITMEYSLSPNTLTDNNVIIPKLTFLAIIARKLYIAISTIRSSREIKCPAYHTTDKSCGFSINLVISALLVVAQSTAYVSAATCRLHSTLSSIVLTTEDSFLRIVISFSAPGLTVVTTVRRTVTRR